ncbi:NAD(+) diphosphatase [Nereida sp. MMG025]|uniref:NAD(+) diphosphatase n=1 Tax=Nereida sp. MMG025 TaxID=2909981 RepID=UPI00351D6758|nr:NAD(+) diphosphatase [Nereida sp. MMG025]
MRHAETVTFGGSRLERHAERRGDAQRLARDIQGPAQVLMMWRGKPLIADAALGLVSATHPLVAQTLAKGAEQAVFLGQDEDRGPLFAVDVSHWVPDDLDDSQLNQFLDPTQQTPPDVPDHWAFCELRGIMTHLSPRDAELAATARGILEWHRIHGFCANCGAASQMAQAGWQRNCPDCGRHHFPRTDPVVIMLITHGNSVLVGRSPGWPDKMYSLLAGFVEPGETLEAAVRREVFEEAGVRVGPVRYLASQPWPFPASLMFGAWGQATTSQITIDPSEIEDAVWVTREEMAQVFEGNHPLINPAREGAIAHFLLHNWLADTLD